MGCSGTKEAENIPDIKKVEKEEIEKKEIEKKEQKEKKEKEKKEQKESKPNKKSNTKKSSNFDEHTINFFKNFDDEEISLIFERKKKVDPDINFVFLYSKFEVDYTNKEFNKTNSVICKEYLVSYVNTGYLGNFSYESQIIGFCLDKVSLNYCSTKINKIPAQIRNTGKIICVLQIEDCYKDDFIEDIMIFEFEFTITQVKMYGMRVIDICYNEKPMTSSILINYDKNIFNINSNIEPDENSKNKFYLFNKDKFCLVLSDKNNDLSIDKDGKYGNLIYSKFSTDEIKQINNSLKNMFIKPYDKNIIYEKITHNLKDNKDYAKGYILIFYPSFEKNYFYLCEGIDKAPDKVDFLITELKINDELLINMKKLEGKNQKKPENYYESTYNSHKYNININEDFILFEFELEGIELDDDTDEIQYSLDAKYIFNFFLNCDTAYKFEIILNNHEVYFNDDETYKYKYKKTKEKITFEGVWKLKEWDNEKSKKLLPNEIIIKKK